MNILNTIKSKLSVITLAKIVFVLAILAVVPVGTAKNKTTVSNIALNTTNAYPLTLNEKKVEVVTGISKEDMDQFNQNPNPESIKLFMQSIASEYGVDWKLVYAIGYHESGNYGSALARNNHNYFGRKAGSGGYASWSTPEEGIRNQFSYLKDKYFDRGLTTPSAINPVYAEDSTWHVRVEAVIASL